MEITGKVEETPPPAGWWADMAMRLAALRAAGMNPQQLAEAFRLQVDLGALQLDEAQRAFEVAFPGQQLRWFW
jgi:hypothetical protein